MMRFKCTAVAITVAFSALFVSSKSASALGLTGNALLEGCSIEGGPGDVFCSAFVGGVADGLAVGSYLGKTCLFKVPDEVTTKQLTDVAVKYIKEHPKDRHESAAILILASFAEAFPCPK